MPDFELEGTAIQRKNPVVQTFTPNFVSEEEELVEHFMQNADLKRVEPASPSQHTTTVLKVVS